MSLFRVNFQQFGALVKEKDLLLRDGFTHFVGGIIDTLFVCEMLPGVTEKRLESHFAVDGFDEVEYGSIVTASICTKKSCWFRSG